MFFLASSLFIISSLFLATPVLSADFGLTETAGAAGLTGFGTSLPGLIGNIIGTGLSLVGVLFFALMLYGGVMWMVARGNAEQEKKAMETITAAIIGILIVLGSYALTSFVFNNLMSGNSGVTEDQPLTDCTGKTGPNVKGCDTCTATKGPAYACRDNSEAKDECWGGSVVDDLCNAKDQGKDIKCCLKNMSINDCAKLNGDLCLLPCELQNKVCTLP